MVSSGFSGALFIVIYPVQMMRSTLLISTSMDNYTSDLLSKDYRYFGVNFEGSEYLTKPIFSSDRVDTDIEEERRNMQEVEDINV
jgi:hypothetical protein